MRYLISILLLINVLTVHAGDTFVVKDIRLEGLQRTSAGAVFNYLPIKIGDEFSTEMTAETIRSLYSTGFFKDVRLEREGNILVVFVAEKPAIASLIIEGNVEIPTDKLTDSLKTIGLSEGKVFDRSVLERIKLELQRQYYSLGKYALQIETSITPKERNRVEVHIKINEGNKAEVYSLNIIGNKTFTTRELLFETSLGEPASWGVRENYSKQILAADIEAIRTYYQDRGYINFDIASTQVSITPDKQDVYVTVNISEGDLFTIDDVKINGDYKISEEEMSRLVEVKSGDIYSRKKLISTRKNISERLAVDGYAFANVDVSPEVDNEKKLVKLSVLVIPGKRVYVRRVNIDGNTKTKDEVVRREIRQMEGGKMSTKLISQSRSRLNRTGYFEEVAIETPAIPGETDMVDVNYSVKERSTGTLQAGVGYSDQSGTVFTFSISQDNFLGTGNKMSLNLSNSESVDEYRLSYTNPYYTSNGVSRSFNVFSRQVDAGQVQDITNYSTNTEGADIGYGFPLSETKYANLSIGYEYTELLLPDPTATEKEEDPKYQFVEEHGYKYGIYKLGMGWRHDSRNRAIFASDGMMFKVGGEYVLPESDIQYYKWYMDYLQYFSFTSKTSILLNLRYGKGEGVGDTQDLPFFEHYYAGGSRSVRGYKSGTLGPKDSNNRSLGGTSRFVGNLELILPNPFAERSDSTRVSLFWDTGYAFGKNEPETSSLLRNSYGVSLIWLTPVGAMRFSYAEPYDARDSDDTQNFQFTLGAPF